MTENKKNSIDLDSDTKCNDVSRSSFDDMNKKEGIGKQQNEENLHVDEVAAKKEGPIQGEIKDQEPGWTNIQTPQKRDFEDNSRNQETQTSHKNGSIHQNQQQRKEGVSQQVRNNQQNHENEENYHQNNDQIQQIHYAPYSQSVLHLPQQRRCCTPFVKIMIFLIFLVIGAGVTFFIISKLKKNRISKINTAKPVMKQFSKKAIIVQSIPSKQISNKPELPKQLPLIKNQTIKLSHPKYVYVPAKNQKLNTTTLTTKTIEVAPIQGPIILSKGQKLFCSDDQLLVNGNCLSCQPGQQWIGLQCFKIQVNYKHRHLERIQYY